MTSFDPDPRPEVVPPAGRASTSAAADVNVRPAISNDVDGIVNVHMRSWRATYVGIVPQEFLDRLDYEPRVRYWTSRLRLMDANAGHFVGVACAEAAIVGFAYACATTDQDDDAARVGLLEFFHVDPDWWGRGIGRNLMAATLAWMNDYGFESASLWVVSTNVSARRFYEALGWRFDGSSRVDHLAVGEERGVELAAVRYRIGLS